MNSLLEVCLVVTLAIGITPTVVAQSQPRAAQPMQKGISVQLPITTNATAMPDADQQEALIVSITDDGTVYVGVNRVSPAALTETVKGALLNRKAKKLYIKADARTSYANVIRVIDAVRTSGVKALSLLTALQESPEPGTLVPPKGIQVWLVRDCPQPQR
jgi:biopolymer transport protein ExbD/biopolymer transport protein TolR